MGARPQVQASRSIAPRAHPRAEGAEPVKGVPVSGQKIRVALLVVTSLLVFSLSNPANAATVGFKPAVNYAVGTAPRAVASGDFNGDGKVDLAVANAGNAGVGDDGSVSILLGNGDGTFQPANNIPAGKNPLSIAVGDFDGDNRLDLVVADSGSDTAGVLLGNGDGTFRSSVGYATGVGPTSIALGDFDGDSRLDLVVLNNGSSTVSVLLSNGDGTFQSHLDHAVGSVPSAVAIGDFNGDGRLDLVVANGRNANGGVLLGNGDGTFQSEVSYGLFFSVAVGDFNSDSRLDLMLTRPVGTSAIADLWTGNADGTFSSSTMPDTGVCQNRYPIAADFNGDGKLDLAIMGGFSVQDGVCAGHHLDVLVLAGNGDGTFQASVILSATDAANLILGAASFDLNGDKAPDLVTVNNDNTLSVLLNAASTDFSISASKPNPDTVHRGQSSTSTVSLSLLNAFDNAVVLTCSVQPTQSAPTCSFDRDSVTFDANGNATATLTINTGTNTASLAAPSLRQDLRPLQFLWLPFAGLALLGAGFGCNRSNRRKLTVYLLGGILFGGLIFEAACGGGGSGPSSTTYTITVTGTSGSTQHSTTTTLKVQ